MTDFSAIKKWSSEKMLSRLGILCVKMLNVENWGTKEYGYLDELVFILIKICKIVISEMPNTGFKSKSPSDLLLSVIRRFDGPIPAMIRCRVHDTREVATEYNSTKDAEKKRRLKAKLQTRGIL